MRFLEIFKNRKVIRLLITAIVVILLFFGIRYAYNHIKFKSYKEISSKEKLTDGSTKYISLQNHIFRYSGDGVSLLTNDLETQWNESLNFTSPMAVKNKTKLAVYDKMGTGVSLFGLKGLISQISTDFPVMSVALSDSGNVAVIVDGDNQPIIRYYTPEGEMIADITGGANDKGYPIDIDVSDNGQIVCVTYLKANEEGVGSELAVYNFGNTKSDSNLVYSEVFEGRIVPDVIATGNKIVILEEKGFSVYRSSGSFTKEKSISLDEEILSAFYDKEYIGLVTKKVSDKSGNVMRIYDTSGDLKSETDINIIYNNICIEDGHILFYNSNEMEVYNVSGIERYHGIFDEGNITSVVKLSRKRYLVTTSSETKIIELKLLDTDNS